MANPVVRIPGRLREGYPDGVPPTDYFPLIALLRRQLTADEVRQVAASLVSGANGGGPINETDIGALITKVTNELPHPEDVARGELAPGGRWLAAGRPAPGLGPHGRYVDDARLWRADQSRRVGRSRPDLGLEEPLEAPGLVDGGELQVDDHVARIVDRLDDPFPQYAALLASLGEPAERRVPGVEVVDRVFDEQCGHGCLPA